MDELLMASVCILCLARQHVPVKFRRIVNTTFYSFIEKDTIYMFPKLIHNGSRAFDENHFMLLCVCVCAM